MRDTEVGEHGNSPTWTNLVTEASRCEEIISPRFENLGMSSTSKASRDQ